MKWRDPNETESDTNTNHVLRPSLSFSPEYFRYHLRYYPLPSPSYPQRFLRHPRRPSGDVMTAVSMSTPSISAMA